MTNKKTEKAGTVTLPQDPNSMNVSVGKRLRHIRDMYGLSQRELARRSGLTNGTISLIEQDLVSPSISSLKRVLDGFPISLSDFFGDVFETEQPAFFKANELTEIAGGPISYRQVGDKLKARSLQVLHEKYEPGADTGKAMISHPGEESGVVISGQIELTVGGRVEVLQEGDAYYFNSRLPHRFRNPNNRQPCIVVSACTPPTF